MKLFNTVEKLTCNLYDIVPIASQMWCLGRFLPLIIGDLVDVNDESWNNYLLHLEIMNEVFAPVYSLDRIPYLKMAIEDFLHDFKSVYPN